MSVIAEFNIPTEAVPGGETLRALPTAKIRLERIIPSDEAVHPIFWVTGVEGERFLDQLRDEDGITDVQKLAQLDYTILFVATWTPGMSIIEGIKTLRAKILNAEGTADKWIFQVIAEERQRLEEFQQIFVDEGIPVELQRMSSVLDEEADDHLLTSEERQTLVVAYEMGYFDEPRQVTQEDIGDQFGITGRAVSKRLRKGTRKLVATSLIDSFEQA